MTELNGKPSIPQGGVLLGNRELTIRITPEEYHKLTILAKSNNAGQTEMAQFILAQGISVGWSQLVIARVFHVMSNWVTYARF